MSHWLDALVKVDACGDAIKWAMMQPSLVTAWRKCDRGDWLLWLIGRCPHNRKRLVRAAALCAEPAIENCDGDTRDLCRYVIQTCVAWSCGEATDEELEVAVVAVRGATWRAVWIEAREARAAARDAARAARDAKVAWGAASWKQTAASLKQSAEIVRGLFPDPPKLPQENRED